MTKEAFLVAYYEALAEAKASYLTNLQLYNISSDEHERERLELLVDANKDRLLVLKNLIGYYAYNRFMSMDKDDIKAYYDYKTNEVQSKIDLAGARTLEKRESRSVLIDRLESLNAEFLETDDPLLQKSIAAVIETVNRKIGKLANEIDKEHQLIDKLIIEQEDLFSYSPEELRDSKLDKLKNAYIDRALTVSTNNSSLQARVLGDIASDSNKLHAYLSMCEKHNQIVEAGSNITEKLVFSGTGMMGVKQAFEDEVPGYDSNGVDVDSNSIGQYSNVIQNFKGKFDKIKTEQPDMSLDTLQKLFERGSVDSSKEFIPSDMNFLTNMKTKIKPKLYEAMIKELEVYNDLLSKKIKTPMVTKKINECADKLAKYQLDAYKQIVGEYMNYIRRLEIVTGSSEISNYFNELLTIPTERTLFTDETHKKNSGSSTYKMSTFLKAKGLMSTVNNYTNVVSNGIETMSDRITDIEHSLEERVKSSQQELTNLRSEANDLFGELFERSVISFENGKSQIKEAIIDNAVADFTLSAKEKTGAVITDATNEIVNTNPGELTTDELVQLKEQLFGVDPEIVVGERTR